MNTLNSDTSSIDDKRAFSGIIEGKHLSYTSEASQLRALYKKFCFLSRKINEDRQLRILAERTAAQWKKKYEASIVPLSTSARNSREKLVRKLKEKLHETRKELAIQKDKIIELEKIISKSNLHGSISNKKVYDSSFHISGTEKLLKWQNNQTERIREALLCTISDLEEDIMEKKERIAQLEHNLDQGNQENNHLRISLEDADGKFYRMEEKITALQAKLDENWINSSSNGNRLYQLHEKTLIYQKKLETVEDLNKALENRNHILSRRLEENQLRVRKIEDMERKISRLENHFELERNQLQEKIKEYSEKCYHLANTLEEAQKKIEIQEAHIKNQSTSPRICTVINGITYNTRATSNQEQRVSTGVKKINVKDSVDFSTSNKQMIDMELQTLKALRDRNRILHQRLQEESKTSDRLEGELLSISSTYNALLNSSDSHLQYK